MICCDRRDVTWHGMTEHDGMWHDIIRCGSMRYYCTIQYEYDVGC